MKATKKSQRKLLLILLISASLAVFFILYFLKNGGQSITSPIIQNIFPSPTLAPTQTPLPKHYIIPLETHVFQTFNNCGPATLSMALSYVGIQISQEELGKILRPYQVVGGDNDDKSVTLEEVETQAKKYGLATYLRPNGTPEKLRKLIANDFPVITRTWLKSNEDIGHYRVVRGYDDRTNEFIQDDSFQGKDLRYTHQDFEELWRPFNYEYVVIFPKEKTDIVNTILGDEVDENVAWKNALVRIEKERTLDPGNWHLTFALSRIHYHLGDYEKAVEEFNKVENIISFRTLWYQIEPVLAIYKMHDYDRALTVSEKILNNQNKAYSELYALRGDIFEERKENDKARQEYEKAVFYNKNNEEFQKKLLNL